MVSVNALAQILITPYEELRIWFDIPYEIREEFVGGDHTMAQDIACGGLLEPYAECSVDTIDSYYSGDHMVLELKLLE